MNETSLINNTALVAASASALCAVAALYVSFRIERRNQHRFDEQIKESREVARLNSLPLISTGIQAYINQRGISLHNYGVGPAVITEIQFSRGPEYGLSLVEFFDFKEEFTWDTFCRFKKNKEYFVKPGSALHLISLSKGNLMKQKLSENEALVILDSFRRQMSGILVIVYYQDVYKVNYKFEEKISLDGF